MSGVFDRRGAGVGAPSAARSPLRGRALAVLGGAGCVHGLLVPAAGRDGGSALRGRRAGCLWAALNIKSPLAVAVALWAALNIKSPLAVAVASLVMGAAVSSMHYTGMFAVRVDVAPPAVGYAARSEAVGDRATKAAVTKR
ncbi:hypothetical protein EAO77_00040 [Streptomyces sp. t39]|nr:hypothetical protein EAO77_00040 [Streptomyces sp. t39]